MGRHGAHRATRRGRFGNADRTSGLRAEVARGTIDGARRAFGADSRSGRHAVRLAAAPPLRGSAD
eukprot:1238399-Alexandrium_andersonii.AAC.1